MESGRSGVERGKRVGERGKRKGICVRASACALRAGGARSQPRRSLRAARNLVRSSGLRRSMAREKAGELSCSA